MDILYVLGKGSKWDNNELRYSLRSIEKFGKNIGKVYVVGYNPGFLSDEVTFIDCQDKYNRKHKNILHCINYAINNSDIGDEFLYSSDDHFYIRETDFDNYPIYKRPKKLPKGYTPTSGIYYRSLCETRTLLESFGLTAFHFSQHGNTHFFKEDFANAKDLIEGSYKTNYGCELTCLMLNYRYCNSPFDVVERKDYKPRLEDDIQSIVNSIKEREVFTSPFIMKDDLKKVLVWLIPR